MSQERRLVAMSIGCNTAMTSSSSDSLMSASRRSSFLFVSSSVALTTAGLLQTTSSTAAVTPQQGAPSLRNYRKIYGKICGITVVPAVLLSSPLPCSSLLITPSQGMGQSISGYFLGLLGSAEHVIYNI